MAIFLQRPSASESYALRLLLALVAISIMSCSESGPSVEEQLQIARQDYEAFDFLAARDGFGEALNQDSDNAEAAYGHARVLMELNQYEDAITAFELALSLAPNNPHVHEGYLNTLVWGGKLRGRRDWLDRTIELGQETIRSFPDRVEPYESVEDAVGELNQSERWLRILDALVMRSEGASAYRINHSQVFRIHHIRARLLAARSSGDANAVATIEGELRHELEVAGAAEDGVAEADMETKLGRQYFLAFGYELLDDADEQRKWLNRLDETPEGREMNGAMIHFDVYYMDHFVSRDSSFEQRLEIIERWKQRFLPTWETGDVSAFRVALSEEQSILEDEAIRQNEESGQVDEDLLDRLVSNGHDLVRLETWSGASAYRWTTELLIDLNVRYEVALAFADEAIAGLKENRAGLIYPGVSLDEINRTRENWIASMERLRGLVLVGLDRHAEAEEIFRQLVANAPRSDRLAALGELLAEQGSNEEAYEILVAALGHDAQDERLRNSADRIRQLVEEIALALNHDEVRLDAEIDSIRIEVADAARQHLTEDRLDRVAPDFNLTDTEGNQWRLSELRGKVVVLNYWATWCGPCRQEFPHYSSMVDSYASTDDVVFLAITTDDDHGLTREFLRENDYRFTVLFDEGSATDFHVNGIPAHFILGPEGRIQYATSGFPGAEKYNEEMRLRIDALRTGDIAPVQLD
ncbi:MAG: redoxin domain-containing protein [Bacteroidetes bacterium]|nr:redoxin domain-containing protein [Bacteroidota bacterium]